jgi:hypothetical protein
MKGKNTQSQRVEKFHQKWKNSIPTKMPPKNKSILGGIFSTTPQFAEIVPSEVKKFRPPNKIFRNNFIPGEIIPLRVEILRSPRNPLK